jgi:DNA mismatch endonuclease (patch repair protein)
LLLPGTDLINDNFNSMADVHSPEVRSYNMSRIRSKNTRPELLLRKALFAHGFRYRLHDKSLPGKPDIVLKKYMTAIFVHGCFWHGHKGCKYYIIPKTRTEWWLNKINSNKKNDSNKKNELKQAGWHVIEIFECELRKEKLKKTVDKIISSLYNE